MPTQEYIKHVYEREGASVREIARRTGVAWRTARKYAQREDWNVTASAPRRQPVMDPVAEIVDTWLQEDRLLPRKQRRNAACIYRKLVDEHQFRGSARTVREYVQKRRRELQTEGATPYVRLAHPPGQAQVDFGEARVVREGRMVPVDVLVLSFPFSNAGFAYPLPSQNQECFLEGLKRLFERIGGVPQRIRFDNLSAAVAHVGKGEARELTETFRRFALHHRFEAEFCGPGRGNEKGNVENKVGYTRRQWLTPPPALAGFEALAEQLWQEAQSDMQRAHYEKKEPIAALWERERAHLLALPAVPFEVARLDHAVLNKYAEFRWEGQVYTVPQGRPEAPVLLKVLWDRIEVRDRSQSLWTTLPRPWAQEGKAIDWAAHFEVYARRPRAAVHAALFPHLPGAVQRFLQEATPERRAARVRLLRDVLRRHPMDRVAKALESLPAERCDDRVSLEHRLYALDPAHQPPPPLAEQHTPPEWVGREPQPAVYDRLLPSPTGGGAA